MAKNLTSRMTFASITVRGRSPQQYVFQTKEGLEQVLYATAVNNWNLAGQAIPAARSHTIDMFFGAKTGNRYLTDTVTFVSNKAAARQLARAQATAKTRQQLPSKFERLLG